MTTTRRMRRRRTTTKGRRRRTTTTRTTTTLRRRRRPEGLKGGPNGPKEAEGPKEARRANRLEVGARRAPELLYWRSSDVNWYMCFWTEREELNPGPFGFFGGDCTTVLMSFSPLNPTYVSCIPVHNSPIRPHSSLTSILSFAILSCTELAPLSGCRPKTFRSQLAMKTLIQCAIKTLW